MLPKFFNSLKPKEYSVQVLRDHTSQSAVKRIKRTRTASPFKKIAALTLAFSIIGGGLASATAATAVTAKQAEANVFADVLCIKAGEKNSGEWNGGANRYGTVGGESMFIQNVGGINKNTKPGDAAFAGQRGTWAEKSVHTPDRGKYLTAYEKYGTVFPIYDAWKPAFSDKEVTISSPDTSRGTYDDGGKLPLKEGTGVKIDSGASPLVTSNIGSCMALVPSISAGIATIYSAFPKFLMGVSLDLFSTAYGTSMSEKGSLLYPIGKAIDNFITQPGGLKDSLFIPFILPLILIGAIWVGYVGIVKRAAMQAVQSTAWMLIAIMLGTVFLAQPTLISSFADKTVASVQRVFNDAVLEPSQSNQMCNIEGTRDKKQEIREMKCTIWHSTIYTPWVAGQFGQGANSALGYSSVLVQEAGRDVLKSDAYRIYYGSDKSVQAQTWPQFMIDRQATNRQPELAEVAWSQLSGHDGAAINTEWAGSMGMISSAILMSIGAAASSAVLIVYGFTLLIYQLMMVTAVLLSPFFFLFGIVPNWGRRVLMRYAELIVSLIMKRIITAGLLTFYLVFYTLIVGDGGNGVLMLKIILILALAIFFISTRGKFVKMFSDNINFGGNKSIGLPGQKAGAVAAGLGVGLLGGGIIGGAIVASRMKKEHKDMSGNIKDIKIDGGSPTSDIKPPPRGPNSGGGGGAGGAGGPEKPPASPLKTVGKVVNTAEDANRVKNLVEDAKKKKAKAAAQALKDAAKESAQGSQNAPSAPNPSSSPTGAHVPSQRAQEASQHLQQQAQQRASQIAAQKAAATQAATPAASTGGAAATSGAATTVPLAGGAAATAPLAGGAAATTTAATTTAATGAAASTGAAAAGVTAGGAAATTGAAAAAGGGAVAAGAAAGSVVPVVGTIAGAAAGAVVVGLKKKKEAEEAEGEK